MILGMITFRGPTLKGPSTVSAAEPSALPSKLVDTSRTDQDGFMTRHGEVKLVAKAAAAEPNIMLSFKTGEEKQLMTYLVSGAYVCVWAFFYFTHDAGEASE